MRLNIHKFVLENNQRTLLHQTTQSAAARHLVGTHTADCGFTTVQPQHTTESQHHQLGLHIHKLVVKTYWCIAASAMQTPQHLKLLISAYGQLHEKTRAQLLQRHSHPHTCRTSGSMSVYLSNIMWTLFLHLLSLWTLFLHLFSQEAFTVKLRKYKRL